MFLPLFLSGLSSSIQHHIILSISSKCQSFTPAILSDPMIGSLLGVFVGWVEQLPILLATIRQG